MMQGVNVLHDPSRGLSMSNYINGRDRYTKPIYIVDQYISSVPS